MQIPIGNESNFEGVVDIILNKELHFSMENGIPKLTYSQIREEFIEKVILFKKKLIDILSQFSEEITQLFLEDKEIGLDIIKREIRRGTISRFIIPVLMGTSLKNIGIEPLIDSIVDYLPSPFEKSFSAFSLDTNKKILVDPNENKKLSALVFKVQYSSVIASHLYFVRVYSGEINPNKKIINASNGKREKFTKF